MSTVLIPNDFQTSDYEFLLEQPPLIFPRLLACESILFFLLFFFFFFARETRAEKLILRIPLLLACVSFSLGCPKRKEKSYLSLFLAAGESTS